MTQPDPALPDSPELKRLREKLAAARSAAANVSATVNISGGVSIEIDADGKLAGLALTPRALRNSPDALSQLIVDAYRRADRQRLDALRTAFADLEADPAVRDARKLTEAFFGTGPVDPPDPRESPVRPYDPEVSWIEQRGSIYDR